MQGVWATAAREAAFPLTRTSRSSGTHSARIRAAEERDLPGEHPVGQSRALELAGHVGRHPSEGGSLLINELGRQLAPWTLERAIRRARSSHVAGLGPGHAKKCTGCLVPGLPAGFRFHDLRHCFASLLIASGAEVKVVQARLRHASATTTLDSYGHLWPDFEERTSAAIDAALAARIRSAERVPPATTRVLRR